MKKIIEWLSVSGTLSIVAGILLLVAGVLHLFGHVHNGAYWFVVISNLTCGEVMLFLGLLRAYRYKRA